MRYSLPLTKLDAIHRAQEAEQKLIATQARLYQVEEYARYYYRVAAKKALSPRDAAPLSFAEWYEKYLRV